MSSPAYSECSTPRCDRVVHKEPRKHINLRDAFDTVQRDFFAYDTLKESSRLDALESSVARLLHSIMREKLLHSIKNIREKHTSGDDSETSFLTPPGTVQPQQTRAAQASPGSESRANGRRRDTREVVATSKPRKLESSETPYVCGRHKNEATITLYPETKSDYDARPGRCKVQTKSGKTPGKQCTTGINKA